MISGPPGLAIRGPVGESSARSWIARESALCANRGSLVGTSGSARVLDLEAAEEAEDPQTHEWGSRIARLGATVNTAAAEDAETLDSDRDTGRNDHMGPPGRSS